MMRIGNLRKALFLGISIGIVTGMILAVLATAPVMTEVEAALVEAKSPQSLQLQTHGYWSHKEVGTSTYIIAVCDTAYGNLIYSSGYHGGLTAVPNGCPKNPQ